MKKYNLPTYEECLEVCNKTGDMKFYKKELFYDKYKIVIFNYRFVDLNDFINNNALEYRGLTFVFNEDGTLYNRFLKLRKFFNLNENDSTQHINLLNKKIKSIHNKEDGSLITFIKLPDETVLATTKMTFENDQSKVAQFRYENNVENIKPLINYCLNNEIISIFELTGPLNRLVLKYNETKLILLRLRCNKTGELLDFNVLPDNLINNIPIATNENYNSLDEMISLSETIEDKEGWVIVLENGLMLKIKTKWYFNLHRLLSDDIHRENTIIEIILDEKLDDIYSKLDEKDSEIKENIELIKNKVYSFIEEKKKIVDNKINEFKNTYNSDKKSFVLNNIDNEDFHLFIKVINGTDYYKVIETFIRKNTYKLEDARKFLNK
jgi:T4 RnlA family RNA ligase